MVVLLRAPSARQLGRHLLTPALPAPSCLPLLLCRVLLGQWQRPPLQPQVRHGGARGVRVRAPDMCARGVHARAGWAPQAPQRGLR